MELQRRTPRHRATGPSRGPVGLVAGGVGGLLLVLGVVAVGLLLSPDVVEGLSIAGLVLAALASLLVAARGEGRQRRAWAAFGVLLVSWATATVLWELEQQGVAGAALARETAYVVGAVAALAGLLLLPAGGWERGAGSRVLLDVAVITVPLLIIGQVLVVRRVAEQDPTMGEVLLLLWPVVDVALAALAFVMTRRRGDRMRPDLALLTLAFAVWAVGDIWVATLTLSGRPYLGSSAQLTYLLAPLLVGLAALTALRIEERAHAGGGVRRHATCRIVSVLPDLVVMTSGLVCIAVGVQGTREWVLVGLGAGLAVLRYAVVAVDSQHLRETLEGRVLERTATLRVVGERLEAIVGSVEDGIVGLRADGVVVFVNPAAARILVTTPEALMGRPACESLCGAAHAECPLCLAAEFGERLERVETSFRRGDDRLVPVEVGATPVALGLADDVLACVVTFRDVSERRAVAQVKHQFVSTVSHELRTPLTAISGALEMLADGDGGELPPDAVALVGSAERGVGRLGRLVADILDAESIASGRFSVVARPLPVGPVVCRVVDALAAWADGHGVALHADVPDLAGGTALADPDRLEQALTNLVGNAVKFSPAGSSVRLSAEVREHDVLLEVADEGRGVPASELPHVFDRFHQVAESDATEKGGAGLGLAITRSIVERHGGEIWMVSEVGRGTTVSFTLPRPVDAPAPEPAVSDAPADAPDGRSRMLR